jgi:hypothetical protein
MNALPAEAFTELANLTTRDEAGQHFTEWSMHFVKLQSAGLINITMPVHSKTGMAYDSKHWTMGITEFGERVVKAYQTGYENADDCCQDSGSNCIPSGGWDAWMIEGVGGDDACRILGEDPDESADGWSETMQLLLQAYAAGGAACCEAREAEEDAGR